MSLKKDVALLDCDNCINSPSKIYEIFEFKRFKLSSNGFSRNIIEYLMCDVNTEFVRNLLELFNVCNFIFNMINNFVLG